MRKHHWLRKVWFAASFGVLLSACGYGGGAEGSRANLALSTVSADDVIAISNGLDRVQITVQLKNLRGERLTTSDGVLTFETPSQGEIEAITDVGDGTYTARYRSLGPAATVTLQPLLDGRRLKETLDVSVQATDNGFFVDTNGAIIRCGDAEDGDTAEIALDGQTALVYTKRNYAQLETLVRTDGDYDSAVRSCTSGITALNDQDPDGPTGLFENISDFNLPLNHWDTSSVTDMRRAFVNADLFNQPLDLWDTSNVESFNHMFSLADRFNGRVDTWNTSRALDMEYMFNDAHQFNQDVSGWDTSRVTNMESMFRDVNLFNQDIGGWDTSNVTDMSRLFDDNWSFNQDLSDWDTSSVTTMAFMFNDAYSFNQDISQWNVSNVESMNDMFSDAVSFSADLSDWDTSNLQEVQSMFEYALSFNSDIGGWNVSNVFDMTSMFNGAANFDQDLSGWCVQNAVLYSDIFVGTTMETKTQNHPPFGSLDNCS